MSQQEYARSRHAAWVSAAALFLDELGRILLVQPTYRREWLLAAGAAEPGESPEAACRREAAEELGLARTPGRLLAVHWLSPGHPDVAPDLPFPGEVRFVFDGGVLTPAETATIELPADELADFAFLASQDAASRMTTVDAQIMLAALRARLAGTTAHLADGHHVGEIPPLDRHHVHTRPRAGRTWPWNPLPVPESMPIPQAWGWCFVPDGRVIVIYDDHPDPAKRVPLLPGGTVEPYDASPEAALMREAAEEAQLTLGAAARLGWHHDPTGEVYGGIGSCARLRLAAPVTSVGPSACDPATGRRFARLLATPAQAAALLGWGEQGRAQARAAARTAHERWGIPHAAPSPVTELPTEGGLP